MGKIKVKYFRVREEYFISFFAVNCFVLLIFLIFFTKETKGKNEAEIEDEYNNLKFNCCYQNSNSKKIFDNEKNTNNNIYASINCETVGQKEKRFNNKAGDYHFMGLNNDI